MIGIDFTNISNSKIIGQLLPYWARGFKLVNLLLAILSPLEPLHRTFQAWALEKYIFCHITGQGPSLQWYLKYRLKDRMANQNDEFRITSGLMESEAPFTPSKWHNNLYWRNDLQWGVQIISGCTDEDYELADKVVVHAPTLKSDPNYIVDDYKREIKEILSCFLTNFKKIIVIINQN